MGVGIKSDGTGVVLGLRGKDGREKEGVRGVWEFNDSVRPSLLI